MFIPPRKVSFLELGDNKFRDFFRQWDLIFLDLGRDFLNRQYAESRALLEGVDLDCTAGMVAAGGFGDTEGPALIVGVDSDCTAGMVAAGGFGDTEGPALIVGVDLNCTAWIGLDAIKGFREGKGDRDDCSIELFDCDGRILIVCRRTPFSVCRCSSGRLGRSVFVVAPGELRVKYKI